MAKAKSIKVELTKKEALLVQEVLYAEEFGAEDKAYCSNNSRIRFRFLKRSMQFHRLGNKFSTEHL